MHTGKNGRGNGSQNLGSGHQRIRSGLSATTEARIERELRKANALPSVHRPVIEVGRGIERISLNGKLRERGRGDLGFPDRI